MAWKKGQSGNPKGRRADSIIARTRARIARNLPAIVDKLAELALAGDVGAAKLLLERVVPVMRPDFAELAERLTALETNHDEN